VIGVNDLERLAELIEPPGNPALLSKGKLLLRPARVASEPCQRADVAQRVSRQDAERPAPARAAIFRGGERNDNVLAHRSLIQIGHRPALHKAFRQVIGKVLYPAEPQLFQRAGQPRPDTLQAGAFGKQGIETIGAHRLAMANSGGHCEVRSAEAIHCAQCQQIASSPDRRQGSSQ
jgi:hypothetical protein